MDQHQEIEGVEESWNYVEKEGKRRGLCLKRTIERRLETEVLAYPAVSVGREKALVIVAGWGVCEG